MPQGGLNLATNVKLLNLENSGYRWALVFRVIVNINHCFLKSG